MSIGMDLNNAMYTLASEYVASTSTDKVLSTKIIAGGVMVKIENECLNVGYEEHYISDQDLMLFMWSTIR